MGIKMRVCSIILGITLTLAVVNAAPTPQGAPAAFNPAQGQAQPAFQQQQQQPRAEQQQQQQQQVAQAPPPPAAAPSHLVPILPFDSVDRNHDQFIDRTEYGTYTSGQLPDANVYPITALDAKARPPSRAVARGENGGNIDDELARIQAPVYVFWSAFLNSVAMIIVTELGDKTFFIAAILAMQHDRMVVYIGALGALAAMTVLSAAIGFALPNLLPRAYTHYAAVILFAYFGFRLLKDAQEMDTSQPNEELEEVEQELGVDAKKGDVESGDQKSSSSSLTNMTPAKWSILTKSFTLTFLAEWGDRSQIATIALASAKDPLGVTIGGVLGHAMCTGLAVVGGRLLATKISERTVAIAGGILFIIFALHSVWTGPDV